MTNCNSPGQTICDRACAMSDGNSRRNSINPVGFPIVVSRQFWILQGLIMALAVTHRY
ncbi:MAG: hypothetical protein WBB28_05505 [Crinalium sp.]